MMFNRLFALLPNNTRQYREETSQRIAWGHWFALFNIVIAILIASRYAFNADWPNTLSGKLYFFISLFGHFSFVVFAFYLLILFPLSFLIKNDRGFRGFSVVFATLSQTLLLVDTEVFKQFYLHLSPLVWDLLVNPSNGELTRQWQLLFVPMPLILLAEMLYSRWCWQKLRSFQRQKWGKYVATFFVCCFIATHLIYAWADMSLNRPIASQKANYPLSYPMTARNFLEKHGLVNVNELEQKAENMGRVDTFYLHYPKQPLQMRKTSTTNILLVNISGLSNEAISQTMPNLTRIAQQSHRFLNHYASANSPMASVLGMFYGLSGKYIDAVLSEKTPSPLINALRQQGYQFGLYSYNGFKAPLYPRALFAKMTLPPAKSNAEAVENWKQWLQTKQDSKPFFSYLELNNTPNADNNVQEIWQTLEAQTLLGNTLVIFTSDLAQTDKTKDDFANARIQVPLIVYWQGDAQNYTQLSSHLDIVPTLLSQFFGVKNPTTDYAQGVDLTKENHRSWILASNHHWNVAILPDGEQYHIDPKGKFEQFEANGEKLESSRPPLPLFLQMIKLSNLFVEK